jgi:hypothetical protein
LQLPSVPHELAALPMHSLSGSVAALMLPQVPFVPCPILAVLQAWQSPAHAELQQ